MADTKITALAPIGAIDPANDVLPIVDVSNNSMAASGTTCRVTTNQLLQANAIASLASATITGALTVDTTTLVVNPAGYPDRVGIGTASPSKPLEVYNTTESTVWANTTTGIALLRAGGTGGDFYFGIDNSTGGGFGQGNYSRLIYSTGAYPIVFSSNASERYRIASDGVATWSNVGGVANTAMTLNSGGLAIGTTTNYGKLSVAGSIASFASNTIGAVSANSGYVVYSAYAGAGAYISFQPTNSSGTQFEAARIDSNGNLILSSSTVPATLASDYQLTLNATSNTNLRFSYRGSDGVTRVANITLA